MTILPLLLSQIANQERFKPVWSVRLPPHIHVLAYDNAREELVCAAVNGTITTLHAKTGTVSRTATTGPNGQGPGVNWTVFRGSGRSDDSLTLRTRGGAQLNLRTLTFGPSFTHDDSRNVHQISPDGNWFTHPSKQGPRIGQVGHGDYPHPVPSSYAVALSPHLKQYVTYVEHGGEVDFTVFRGEDGAKTNTFTFPAIERLSGIQFTPDGRFFTFFSTKHWKHIFYETTQFTRMPDVREMPVELVFSPNSQWAVNLGWEFAWTAKGWDSSLAHIPSGQKWTLPHLATSQNGYDFAAMTAAFAPDLGLFFVTDNSTVAAYRLPSVK